MLPKLKFLRKLNETFTRKRDKAEVTYRMHIGLTTDEAILISSMFTRAKEADASAPTMTLFRRAVLMIAEEQVEEKTLVVEMAKWRTRARLADTLAEADYNRAISFLDGLTKPTPTPAPKPRPATIIEPKKIRREFVPEPRKR